MNVHVGDEYEWEKKFLQDSEFWLRGVLPWVL